MLRAVLRRLRILRLEREYNNEVKHVREHSRWEYKQTEMLRLQNKFLEDKAKVFKDGPTMGGLLWMLWYGGRYKWWVAKERRFTNWILKATPYIKVGRQVHSMEPGSSAQIKMQERVDRFYAKYDWIVASYTEARNRHLGVK